MIDDRELDPQLPSAERESLVRLGEDLERRRPLPSPAFRGELRRRLLSRPTRGGSQATTFRPWAVSYVTLGLISLAVAGLGLAGVGPFAA